MTDSFLGAFFSAMYFPEGLAKKKTQMGLPNGKILNIFPPVFCPILNPPKTLIRQNPKKNRKLIYEKTKSEHLAYETQY